MKFLKNIFLLPKLTPHFFPRLELQSHHQELFFIRNCIRFWLRLINKKKESLVYNAYMSVKEKPKQNNWFRDFKALLEKWKLDKLLDLEYLHCRKKIQKIIREEFGKAQNQYVQNDIIAMQRSSTFNLYGSSKTHYKLEPYLNDNNKWYLKQLTIQLKLGMSHVTYMGKSTNLRSLRNFYDNSCCDKCVLCGVEREDIYHLIFNCVHYQGLRNRYLCNFKLTNLFN